MTRPQLQDVLTELNKALLEWINSVPPHCASPLTWGPFLLALTLVDPSALVAIHGKPTIRQSGSNVVHHVLPRPNYYLQTFPTTFSAVRFQQTSSVKDAHPLHRDLCQCCSMLFSYFANPSQSWHFQYI